MNEENTEKVIQIMENMQSEFEACGKYRFSAETRRLISEVAEYCRKTKIYNLAKKKMSLNSSEQSLQSIYIVI